MEGFVEDSPIVGASGKTYYATTNITPENAAITLTAINGRTIESVTLPEGIEGVTLDGLTLTLTSDFKGGLQNLILVLNKIVRANPSVAAEVYIANYVPDNYVAPYSVSTVDAAVPNITADNASEGEVRPCNQDNHAGITAPASLVGDVIYSVRLFHSGEEVTECPFTVHTHSDGSVSVILSNTYLLSLGCGTHEFTVVINGQEITFTVTVNT